jgi:putative metallopeptidase
MEYVSATKEVRSIVKAMRARHYEKFKKAKIVILLRLGKWNKWGTLARVGKKQRQAGIDGDYILTFNGDAWPKLSEKQKKALVDHELYHMSRKKTKNGVQFKLRDHDVEEFVEIVKRYGDWTPNLKALHEVLSAK